MKRKSKKSKKGTRGPCCSFRITANVDNSDHADDDEEDKCIRKALQIISASAFPVGSSGCAAKDYVCSGSRVTCSRQSASVQCQKQPIPSLCFTLVGRALSWAGFVIDLFAEGRSTPTHRHFRQSRRECGMRNGRSPLILSACGNSG